MIDLLRSAFVPICVRSFLASRRYRRNVYAWRIPRRPLVGITSPYSRWLRKKAPSVAAPLLSSPPREPTMEECCGNDCSNCVWIEYSRQLADYVEQQQQHT